QKRQRTRFCARTCRKWRSRSGLRAARLGKCSPRSARGRTHFSAIGLAVTNRGAFLLGEGATQFGAACASLLNSVPLAPACSTRRPARGRPICSRRRLAETRKPHLRAHRTTPCRKHQEYWARSEG